MSTKAQSVSALFRQKFGSEPLLVRSPGRINLLGEHTDYNQGYVMPAAIENSIYVALGKRDDDELHFISVDLEDSYQTHIGRISSSGKLWPDYMLGVLDDLGFQGFSLTSGLNIVVGGDIPQGAGLSSSAALECAFAKGVSELLGFGLDNLTIVKTAQAAENNFVGVNCGMMDQFASVYGKANQVIRLDCRSLEYEYLPFDFPGITVLLLDTGVKHSLASSAYNKRRAQCQMGVDLIKLHHPEVESLRDVTAEMLLRYVYPHDRVVYDRCLYVVSENERLIDAGNNLKNNDLVAFGQQMFATHQGLQHLYQVSCPELDLLIELVKNKPGVLGARMMGGGFGGCTINLIETTLAGELIEEVSQLYQAKTGIALITYNVKLAAGTEIMEAGMPSVFNNQI